MYILKLPQRTTESNKTQKKRNTDKIDAFIMLYWFNSNEKEKKGKYNQDFLLIFCDRLVHLRMEPSTHMTHSTPRSKLTCLWPLGQATIDCQSVPEGLEQVTRSPVGFLNAVSENHS